MATEKLTEQQILERIAAQAHIFISQKVNESDAYETLARATLASLIQSLRQNGVNEGLVTSETLQQMYPNLMQNVEETDTGLRFTFWDSSTLDITIEPGGLDFDEMVFDQENGMLHIMKDGDDVVDPCFIGGGGGGGGGGSNNATLTITNTTGWIAKSISEDATCVLSGNWSSLEQDTPTGDGTLTVRVGGAVKQTTGVKQGNFSVDVTKYLQPGSNTVKLTVADVYGNSRSINFTVTKVALSISSTFDATKAYNGNIAFPYIPRGEATKVMHYILDGEEIGTETFTISGRQRTYTIPQQSHGSHKFEVYFTADVGGQIIDSNHLVYDLICIEEGNTTPIIACVFEREKIAQYETVNIKYIAYTPGTMTSEVKLSAGDKVIQELTVDRTEQTWAFRADDYGSLTLKISSGSVTKTLTTTVEPTDIGVEAVTEDLELHLSSYGRSNSEQNPASWVSGDIACSFQGYNWKSDGWQLDEDGVTVHRVSGDARLTIPFQMFAQDFRTAGKTIEFEFATRDVLDYTAVVASCFAGDRGFRLTAQTAVLKSGQSEIRTSYNQNEHIRLGFVIEKKAENRVIYLYLNGIICGATQYPEDDDFSQMNPVGITIGSNDCTIDLYNIRVYNNSLNRYQMLDNWIADTPDINDKLARAERNRVYDAYGNIVIEKLPKNLPYLVLSAPVLPQYKGNKLAVSGYFVMPQDTAKSFEFNNAQADVQGTSSAGYERKNYKIKFKYGFIVGENVADGYAMRPDSIPTSTFTFKADVASSEGANNVELVRLYNRISPHRTPPQLEDPRIRQGIDGFPIVIFHDDGNGPVFIGKYNFNNDKGTPEVFGFADGDESWEIRNNTSNRVLFKDANFSGDDWKNDFEARYPEDNENIAKLKQFVEWVVSTDQSAATGGNLPTPVTYDEVVYDKDTAAYRLAKFKAEFADYADLDSACFYYLFTEVFLMVDSRAKNAFPSCFVDGKWCWLPYDMDTAIGINNEGALVFGYELEDIDQTEAGADIYNGQKSVIWVNLRQAFFKEIMEMYQQLRSDNLLSYEIVESAFEEHQAAWPEAIWNEDAFFKYLQPLFEKNNSAYLGMLQGNKAEQRKWWLFNRFRYIDSKYNAGDALSDFITLRGYAKDSISVEPYADIYASIKYGSYLVQERALRGSSYTLDCPLDNLNDTEIYIYSASQLKSIGDLSGLKVGYADFSKATKLTHLKVGDASAEYSNGNFTELYLGNNTLLQTLDVRNCPNLGTGATMQSVDLSGCTNIENVYFDGTAITGLKLPNGGILKVLHLPGTVTNLTIQNQTGITDFTMPDYSKITTLRLENVSAAVNSREIFNAIPTNSRVRLIGFNWSFDDADSMMDFFAKLDGMRGLDESGNDTTTAQVSGTVYVPDVTSGQLSTIKSKYPDVKVLYDTVYHSVTFKNYDGTVLHTEMLVSGSNVEDPVTTGKINPPTRPDTDDTHYAYNGWGTLPTNLQESVEITAKYAESYALRFYNDEVIITTVYVSKGGDGAFQGSTVPTKESTAQYDYTFTGWSRTNGGDADDTALKNITEARNVYAAYSSTIRKYTVKFYNGPAVMQTITDVEYGSDVEYTALEPTKASDAQFIYTFNGWSKTNDNTPDEDALTNIVGDTSIYASFATVTRTYTVYFYNGTTLLQTLENVPYGDSVSYTGTNPTKTADAQYIYTFSGWSRTNGGSASAAALENITGDTNIFAAYSTTLQKYTVRFMNGSTVLQTVGNVPYGGTATFTGTNPVSPVEEEVFAGWYPSNINIKGDTDCQPVFSNPNALDAKSWAEISEISADGTAANFFAVGDCKAVTLNGTVGTLALDNVTYYVYILGFDHNSTLEGTGITFGTFKTAKTGGIDICLDDANYNTSKTDGTKAFNMNHWGDSNRGGWSACDLRYDILGSTDTPPKNYGKSRSAGDVGYDASATCATNPVANTLMAALPSDLRAVMKPMTVYSDNVGGATGHTEANVTATVDYLPLLGEMEIFGSSGGYNNNTEDAKQQQYAYYAAGNSKIKKKHSASGSAAGWWERSAYYSYSNSFCGVLTYGNAASYYATYSYGLAPAFKV